MASPMVKPRDPPPSNWDSGVEMTAMGINKDP